jgi:hypothetical protein
VPAPKNPEQCPRTWAPDQRGRRRTTLATFTPKDKKPKEWPKSLKLFHQVLVVALLDGGIDMHPCRVEPDPDDTQAIAKYAVKLLLRALLDADVMQRQ